MNLSPWSKYNIWVLAYNLKDNSKLKSSPEKSFMVETKQGRKCHIFVSCYCEGQAICMNPQYDDLANERIIDMVLLSEDLTKNSTGDSTMPGSPEKFTPYHIPT